MEKHTTQLTTMNQLQKLMPKILKEHGDNQKLQKAGLSNPILALEEIGYKLSNSLKKEVEYRVRFTLKNQQKLTEIRNKVNKITGRKVDLSSGISISNSLKKLIKTKTIKSGKKIFETKSLIEVAAKLPEINLFKSKSKKDPLLVYRGSHEVVSLLLEYRKIEASTPRLASKTIFNDLLKGSFKNNTGINIKNVRFKMQDRATRKDRL